MRPLVLLQVLVATTVSPGAIDGGLEEPLLRTYAQEETAVLCQAENAAPASRHVVAFPGGTYISLNREAVGELVPEVAGHIEAVRVELVSAPGICRLVEYIHVDFGIQQYGGLAEVGYLVCQSRLVGSCAVGIEGYVQQVGLRNVAGNLGADPLFNLLLLGQSFLLCELAGFPFSPSLVVGGVDFIGQRGIVFAQFEEVLQAVAQFKVSILAELECDTNIERNMLQAQSQMNVTIGRYRSEIINNNNK